MWTGKGDVTFPKAGGQGPEVGKEILLETGKVLKCSGEAGRSTAQKGKVLKMSYAGGAGRSTAGKVKILRIARRLVRGAGTA